jgi:hypothetical protein
VFAYRCARRYARPALRLRHLEDRDPGRLYSAIALLGVAALMAVQSLERLWVPAPIHYNEAIAIAAVGLGVACCAPGGCTTAQATRIITTGP